MTNNLTVMSLPGQVILDALPDPAAVIDTAGTIVGVNRAWQMFCEDNGGSPQATGVGVNYLQVCRRAADMGDLHALETVQGIEDVAAGGCVDQEFDYPCSSAEITRWFRVRVTQMTPGLMLITHSNITRYKEAARELEVQAATDPLTGLANRRGFVEHLEQLLDPAANAPGDTHGLLYVDLDRFKSINDGLGHSAGDELLQTVAHRIRQQVREGDLGARVGGDEFAVLLAHMPADHLAECAERIRAQISQPVRLHGRTFQLTASVGSSAIAPGETVEEVTHRADAAMYEGKRGQESREVVWMADASQPPRVIQHTEPRPLVQRPVPVSG